MNEKEVKLNERKKVNKQKYNTSPYLQVKTYADVLMSNAAKTTPDQIVLMPDTTFSNNDSIDSRSPLTSSLNSTPYLQALVLGTTKNPVENTPLSSMFDTPSNFAYKEEANSQQ